MAFLGYTLFSPNQDYKTYLIENCGLKVHEWESSYQPGMMSYLREDGLLLRAGRDFANHNFASTGGNGGVLELIDWWSVRQWGYKVSNDSILAHHEIFPMPNGNVLVIVWDKHDQADAVQNGRNPLQIPDGEIYSESIYELRPRVPDSAELVWEWRLWDHLIQDYDLNKSNYGVVSDHPELMDINYLGISQGDADWLHANSIAYNADRNEVILGFRETSEVIVIDHSTTTAEAAGHTGGTRGKGGDILWRWGNPEAYGQGSPLDQRLFEQHDAHWVENGLAHAGEVIIFNNGLTRPGGRSSVEFVQPEIDLSGNYVLNAGRFMPDSAQHTFWTHPGDTIDATLMGGAQILPNGNLFVAQATHGRFVEFDSTGQLAWEYISPILPLSLVVNQGSAVPGNTTSWSNAVFKCRKYAPEYPGLAGFALPHGDPLEGSPYPDTTCSTPVGRVDAVINTMEVYPNPACDVANVRFPSSGRRDWEVLDLWGRRLRSGTVRGAELEISVADLPDGVYVLKAGTVSGRLIVGH
ncbi:MAG: aryl-sulfate sulfotransferase [Bacteroidia bacterium]